MGHDAGLSCIRSVHRCRCGSAGLFRPIVARGRGTRMSLGHPSRPSGILPLGSVTRVRFRRLPLRRRRGRFWDVRSLSCGVCRGGPPSFLSFSLGGTSERRTLVRSWRISTLESGTKLPGSKTNHRPLRLMIRKVPCLVTGWRMTVLSFASLQGILQGHGPIFLEPVLLSCSSLCGGRSLSFNFVFLLLLIEKRYFC